MHQQPPKLSAKENLFVRECRDAAARGIHANVSSSGVVAEVAQGRRFADTVFIKATLAVAAERAIRSAPEADRIASYLRKLKFVIDKIGGSSAVSTMLGCTTQLVSQCASGARRLSHKAEGQVCAEAGVPVFWLYLAGSLSVGRIRYELSERGLTPAAVARAAGLPQNACGLALRRPHPAGEQAIADALGMDPAAIWPDRYASPDPSPAAKQTAT